MIFAFLSVAASVGLSRFWGWRRRRARRPLHHDLVATPLRHLRGMARVWSYSRAAYGSHGLIRACLCGNSRTAAVSRELGRARRATSIRIEHGLRNRVSTQRLIELACPALFPDRTKVYESLKMLKKAGVGEFRYMVDDGFAANEDGSRIVR